MNTDTVDYQTFCRSAFPALVKIFDAYGASVITDLDQDLEDFEDIVEEALRTGKDVDGRDTVFRIYPTNFFDDILCHRAFCMSSHEMVVRLSKVAVLSEEILSGAFFSISDVPVTGAALKGLDAQIRRLLKT